MEKFNISWHYTNKLVNDLMKINSAKEIVELLKLPVSIEDEIKNEITLKRVHYSTKIEGNTLNLKEVKEALSNNKKSHERNVLEVRNYYNALMYLNEYSKNNDEITEDLILKVHNLVCGKSITYKNKFRDGQNVVKNSETGSIVYLPPEAKDVKDLIGQMIDDFNNDCDIPIPIKAGIVAYQFVTIHPFWDENGRVSRLLATYILKSYGYDLNGFYVMEEFYDKNIDDYYNSLQMNLNHNFYYGRKDADITQWLEYFVGVMASTFETVQKKVEELYENNEVKLDIVDTLDKRERWVANYVITNNKIKAKAIALHFKISIDTANNWIKKWVEKSFLERYDNEQIRNVDYVLCEKYYEKLK